MSEVINVLQTSNQLITNYDVSKFLLGFNSFVAGNLEASGSDVALKQGLVLGRVSASGLLVPMDATATDGSQYPTGLCIIDQTVLDGNTDKVQLVNKGRIAEGKINFSVAGQTLDTVVDGRMVKDWLNDLGLILENSVELTNFDNQ